MDDRYISERQIAIAQVKVGDPHGLYRVFVGLVSTEGYNMGSQIGPSITDVADGTLMSPYMMKYAQSAEIALPDRTVIDFTGGDVWTGSYVYGITSLGSFALTSSTVETDLIAMLSRSSVDQTENTRQTIFADNIMRSTPPQAWLMTVFRLQSKEAGSVGADKFLTIVLPRVWVSPKGIAGAPNFQAAGTYGFTIIPTVGDRAPWGPDFTDTGIDMDLENDQTPNFYMITDNPVHMVTMTAAAGATEVVTLPFKPVAFDYTSPDSATDPVNVYVDGVQTNATTVVASTGAVTVTDTFTGGEVIGIIYETNYEPTS